MQVIWYDAMRGSWDHGLLQSVFDAHPHEFIQHNTKENPLVDRAIVIVVGCPEIVPLRAYLETVKSGIVILTSEEDGYFDYKDAIPEHLEIFTQYFTESKREIKNRILLGAPNRIKDYKINKHLPKKYLYSFVGQSQNPFRQDCIEVLSTMPNRFLFVADMFGGYGEVNIEYQEYLDIMCQSQFVLCPSGSMCTDSFRLYESILCGAIPIVDKRSPRDAETFDYWEEVMPGNTLIKVDNWQQIKSPRFIADNVPFYDINWFDKYKQQLEQKLINIANEIH